MQWREGNRRYYSAPSLNGVSASLPFTGTCEENRQRGTPETSCPQ